MSFFQRLFASVLPRHWMEAMEAGSRTWRVRCARCGFARSVWDIGGIRYRAAGQPRWYRQCPQCGRRSWHKVSRDATPAAPPGQP
jgi:ribosomal protein L37E